MNKIHKQKAMQVADAVLCVALFLFSPAFYYNLGYCESTIIDYGTKIPLWFSYFGVVYILQENKSIKENFIGVCCCYAITSLCLFVRYPFVEFPDELHYMFKLWGYFSFVYFVWGVMNLVVRR